MAEKEILRILSKGMPFWVGVSGFPLFRVRIKYSEKRALSSHVKQTQGCLDLLRKHAFTCYLCYVNEVCAPPRVETLIL